MQRKPQVAILLATYNGQTWLTTQLESILNQVDVDMTLYVSDDNSDDSTLKILNSFAEKHECIKIKPFTAHSGSAAQNFFSLIKYVDLDDVSYIALCDQDDIWLPNKLKRAIEIISTNGVDGYSSNVTAFWPNGRSKLIDKSQPQKEYDYMFESPGPGCTFVLTKKVTKNLKQILSKNLAPLPELKELHDWFIYAFVRSNGYKWFIDSESTLLYRQHENNVLGANTGLNAAIKRLKKLRQGWYLTQVHDIATILGYESSLPISKIKRLNIGDRLYLALRAQKFRRRLRDRFAFILFILFLAKI